MGAAQGERHGGAAGGGAGLASASAPQRGPDDGRPLRRAYGIFLEEEKDLLNSYTNNEDFDFLERFLQSDSSYDAGTIDLSPGDPRLAFATFSRLGVELRRKNSFPTFKRVLDGLNSSHEGLAETAKVALCHGIFAKAYSYETVNKEYRLFSEFLEPAEQGERKARSDLE